jgi:conjugative transposon TraN protein
MNRLCAAGLLGVFFLMGIHLYAQTAPSSTGTIDPYKIAISYYQTTNLIFPYAIKSVDRGSGAVIVQKAKGVDNILQAKAAQKDFEPTNLSVVTADGKFYSFLLAYADEPMHLNISFSIGEPVQFADEALNERKSEQESWQVRGTYGFMKVQRKQQDMRMQLKGIWFSENTLWYKLQFNNRSQVDFRTDYLRFFLRDRKRAKRTAIQETEMLPVYQSITRKIDGSGQAEWVIGFHPFTVPPDKKLIIQISEKGNGRTVILPVKSKIVLKARRLPNS